MYKLKIKLVTSLLLGLIFTFSCGKEKEDYKGIDRAFKIKEKVFELNQKKQYTEANKFLFSLKPINNDDFFQIYFLRGVTYYNNYAITKAFESFNEAKLFLSKKYITAKNEKISKLNYYKGLCFFRKATTFKEKLKGVKYLIASLKANEKNYATLFSLGTYCESLNQNTKARKYYELALESINERIHHYEAKKQVAKWLYKARAAICRKLGLKAEAQKDEKRAEIE